MAVIFLNLVNLSITAGWLVLAILLLRVLMKKAPKWVHCAMWGLVGIRLVFPFSLESIFSLIPSAETFEPEMLKSRQFEINTGIEVLDTPVNDYMASHYYEGVTTPANFKVDVTSILAVVWMIGVAVMLGYAFLSCRKLKKDMKTATSLETEANAAAMKIRLSDKVGSPFVLGLLRPVIYLPYNINETDRAYVIAHEEAHIRRKDHWIKPIGFLILSVYWFHPLLWLAYVMLCKDIELACDEKVIHSRGYDERQDYSLALLNCSIKRYRIAACPLAFGEVSVKERIKSVMHYKKPGFWVVVASIVVCAIVAVCFLTDPAYNKLYAPEPFFHSYRVEEVIYAAPQYSFAYTPKTAPQYSLTSDYAFLEQQANSGDWEQINGGFEEAKLTKDSFDACFIVVDNVSGFAEVSVSEQAGILQAKQVAKLRKENKKTWRLDVTGESGGIVITG